MRTETESATSTDSSATRPYSGSRRDLLWLLPFFPSPLKDDGYDVTDYRDVRSALGTMSDVRRLIDKAHPRGIRIAAEMVINHTSDEHPWFQAARTAPSGSPLRDFYVWSDRPDRFGSEVSRSSSWTWDPARRLLLASVQCSSARSELRKSSRCR